MPTFFFNSVPSSLTTLKFNKKKRPPNLNLTPNSFSASASSEAPSPFSPISTCTTPELITFLASLSVDNAEKTLIYNTKNLVKNGQNGIVKTINFFFPPKNEICTLVKKQGGSGVKREIMITNAIKSKISKDFPVNLFALPIYQESSPIINIHYTYYRKLGDLGSNIDYIQRQIQLEDSSVLSYLFHIFYQLTIALEALHDSEFKDEKGEAHSGIVHNDIKPDNIFLKENGNIELADFGCSYFKNSPAPQLATYLFSAPELWVVKNFCKKPISKIDKTDIWSLGATLMYVLTNELMAPPFSSKNLSEFDQIFCFKEWGKKYSQQWEARVTKNCSIDKKASSEQDLVNLLKENFNITSDSSNVIKKTLLENLALLMQAPIEVRPDAKELKNRLDKLNFIIDGEPEIFVSQLLDRKNDVNAAFSQPKNGYVCISPSKI